MTPEGTAVAKYAYDAWGRVVYSTGSLASINPLRYRGYYYDTESQLYYLQSRYYDPAMKRFINADAFASTGQSFLGYNMFAYCGNNPVNFYDASGNWKTPIDDRYVHNQVLDDICQKYDNMHMYLTCIKYTDESGNYTGRIGFCDIYNSHTGEVWELKKDSNSRSCRTENAIKQLNKYVTGRLLHNSSLPLKTPYTTSISTQTITRYSGNWIYEITYWYEGNGILRYSYTKSLNKKLIQLEILAAAGILSAVYAPQYLPYVVGAAGNVATLY